MTLGKEAALPSIQFEETRAKWVEVHNVVLAVSDREAASTERLNNFEAALNSKTEEVAAVEEKYARLEERHKIVIEHNRVFNHTVHDHDVSC